VKTDGRKVRGGNIQREQKAKGGKSQCKTKTREKKTFEKFGHFEKRKG